MCLGDTYCLIITAFFFLFLTWPCLALILFRWFCVAIPAVDPLGSLVSAVVQRHWSSYSFLGFSGQVITSEILLLASPEPGYIGSVSKLVLACSH